MSNDQRPKVGIGVMIFKDGKVLVCKRKGAHGQGQYAWPGGHLEYMESIVECAKRETREEAGIEIENVRFLRLMNLKEYAPKHYVDIAMIADWKSGEPQVLEPEKCEFWGWYDPCEIPQPRFGALDTYLDALETGNNFYDV
ncbi:NUDIX domain-containing protein [Candidatus Nomurabacteria bacterium]|nr:NUDIX domain-containing protein [Candidatus Nomurabacteria bacterium]